MTPTRIVLLSHDPGAPSLSLVAADGRVVERRALEPSPSDVLEPLPCVLIVPGAQALARWLDLPVKSEAQAGPAAALLLEEQLATPIDRMHLALAAPDADRHRMAVVVERAVLDGWMERATALGVFPDVVLPDHLALPDQDGDETIAVRFGDTYAVRGRRLALSCEADLLPLVLAERPWREIESPAEIEAMVLAAAAAPVVNLLQPTVSVVEPPSTWRQLRAAAVLLGLLALSPLALSVVHTVRHDAAAREIDRQTEARVRAALPAAQPIVNPDAQLRSRIEGLRTTNEFPLAAAALFTALRTAPTIELNSLAYEPGQPLRANLAYAAPAELEAFRAAAGQAGFTVEAGGAVTANGRILSDIRLSRAR